MAAIVRQAPPIRHVAAQNVHPLSRAIVRVHPNSDTGHDRSLGDQPLSFVHEPGADPTAAETGKNVEIRDFRDSLFAKGRIAGSPSDGYIPCEITTRKRDQNGTLSTVLLGKIAFV